MEGTFFKQPAEVFDVELDMTALLPQDDPLPTVTAVTITSVKRIPDPVTGEEVDGAASTPDIIGSLSGGQLDPYVMPGTARIVWWLKAGTSGDRHKMTVRMTLSSGQVREADVGLEIRSL